MWKPEHRRAADRTRLRYPSDLSDAEWLIVDPMIPPAKRGGRRRSVNVREVLNGIFYVLWTGCQWKALPKDLPPKSTVHDYLELWNWDGTLERIHHELYVAVREQEGREPSPTVAIIDSQTAKGAQKGGLRSAAQSGGIDSTSLVLSTLSSPSWANIRDDHCRVVHATNSFSSFSPPGIKARSYQDPSGPDGVLDMAIESSIRLGAAWAPAIAATLIAVGSRSFFQFRELLEKAFHELVGCMMLRQMISSARQFFVSSG